MFINMKNVNLIKPFLTFQPNHVCINKNQEDDFLYINDGYIYH